MGFGLRSRRARAAFAAAGLLLALGVALPAPGLASEGDAPPAIAPPGDCATPRPHVAIYTTPADGTGVAAAKPADLGEVLGSTSDRFDPNEVAAGDGGAGLSPPPPASPAPPNPCSGVCAGPTGPGSPPPPVVAAPPPSVIESPPVFRPPPGLPVHPTP